MIEKFFSKKYLVRKLNTDDVDLIYELCRKNTIYYEYCPPMVTKESVVEDLAALPPGITLEDKYFVGFFDGDRLIAVMDLIDGYPEKNIAFIGFFMMDTSTQKSGIGTEIISELMEYLKDYGCRSVRLAWVVGNPQAEHFWVKNRFVAFKETTGNDVYNVMVAERIL